jgi:hypothetical protein
MLIVVFDSAIHLYLSPASSDPPAPFALAA